MGDGGAGKRQAQRDRDIITEQRRQFEEAQQVLGLARDQGITDLQAAEARAQGLITDQQEAIISSLNRGGEDAISTLEQLEDQANSQLQTAESNILDTIATTAALSSDEIRKEVGAGIQNLEDVEKSILNTLVDTGTLQKEALTENTLQGIADITEFSDAALETLQPYREEGERALLQTQVLSGRATPEEVERFREEFGDLESSPLVQERIKEEERAIARQQQALGRRFSGLGQGEILEKGSRQIREQELARQFQSAQQGAQLGFGAASQAAGIQQGTGQNLLAARSNLGQLLSQQLAQQQQGQLQLGSQRLGLTGQLRNQLVSLLQQNRARQQELQTGIQQGFAGQRAQLAGQVGQGISGIQQQTGAQQSQILQNLLNQQTGLATGLGTGTANMRTGTAAPIAETIQRGATSETQGLLGASAQQAQSEGSFLRDIAGLGSTLVGGLAAGTLGLGGSTASGPEGFKVG